MFAVALHAGDIQGIESQYQGLLRWVSLLVASFVVFYSARTFFSTAWRHLRQRALVMDLPVALAIGLAWLASAWATVTGTGQVYFDSVVMFTFFLLLGRFLERRVRQRHQFTWFDAQRLCPMPFPHARRAVGHRTAHPVASRRHPAGQGRGYRARGCTGDHRSTARCAKTRSMASTCHALCTRRYHLRGHRNTEERPAGPGAGRATATAGWRHCNARLSRPRPKSRAWPAWQTASPPGLWPAYCW